ncbi:MAG: STAS domain-containing protein [Planctomycetota bacterium]|jgi:anti-anti-sigma factor|nr:STAS domain-containing protein [Planctomycetota bacterium]
MDIVEQRQGAVTVVKPLGPLVQGDADQFGRAVKDVMQRSLGRFVIDASAVAFVDSRGLEVLLEATEALAAGGGTLRFCGANETVREVLDLTEVGSQCEHFEEMNSAVRSFLT